MEKITRNAAGTEGFLLIYPDITTAVDTGRKSSTGNKMCGRDVVKFRIYERDGEGNVVKDEKGHAKFTDYEIYHHDLRVKLLDGVFVEKDGKKYIDYY